MKEVFDYAYAAVICVILAARLFLIEGFMLWMLSFLSNGKVFLQLHSLKMQVLADLHPRLVCNKYFQENTVGMVDDISGVLESFKYTIWLIKQPCHADHGYRWSPLHDREKEVQAWLFLWIKRLKQPHFNIPSHLNIISISHMLWVTTTICGMQSWLTESWPCHEFPFPLGITKINDYIALKNLVFKTNDPKTVPKLIHFLTCVENDRQRICKIGQHQKWFKEGYWDWICSWALSCSSSCIIFEWLQMNFWDWR